MDGEQIFRNTFAAGAAMLYGLVFFFPKVPVAILWFVAWFFILFILAAFEIWRD